MFVHWCELFIFVNWYSLFQHSDRMPGIALFQTPLLEFAAGPDVSFGFIKQTVFTFNNP